MSEAATTTDHASRGRGPRTRGKSVVTDGRNVRDETNGTKKPGVRRTSARRAEVREVYGEAAGRVVQAYCDQRILVGLPPAPRSSIGPLAGQCLRLLAGGRWDEPSLTAAAEAFAATKRFPGYFEEWAREAMFAAADKEHAKLKENFSLPPEVLAAMGMVG